MVKKISFSSTVRVRIYKLEKEEKDYKKKASREIKAAMKEKRAILLKKKLEAMTK